MMLGIGKDDAPKMRKKAIDFLGGEKALFDMLQTGLLGMAGIDARMSLAIRPFSPFVDPLMGESVIMGLGREIKGSVDDVSRARYYKAFFENAMMPNAVKRVAKAVRESTLEGKTTYLGDTVLDFNGNPIKLSTGEAVISAMGFVPARIGRYYSAVMGIKEFQQYWSKEKSEIGTMYKIARIARDGDKMADVKRRIDWFNREMKTYKEAPTPAINSRTMEQWEKGSGSERMREIARYYYE
jgi:hypothetical protein